MAAVLSSANEPWLVWGRWPAPSMFPKSQLQHPVLLFGRPNHLAYFNPSQEKKGKKGGKIVFLSLLGCFCMFRGGLSPREGAAVPKKKNDDIESRAVHPSLPERALLPSRLDRAASQQHNHHPRQLNSLPPAQQFQHLHRKTPCIRTHINTIRPTTMPSRSPSPARDSRSRSYSPPPRRRSYSPSRSRSRSRSYSRSLTPPRRNGRSRGRSRSYSRSVSRSPSLSYRDSRSRSLSPVKSTKVNRNPTRPSFPYSHVAKRAISFPRLWLKG